jgi:tetratricopeptide (TPR) repeat protein
MDIKQAYKVIVDFCVEGKIDEALKVSHELLEKHPDDRGIKLLLAQLYPYPDFSGPKMDQSVAMHKELEKANPKSQTLKLKLADSMVNNENYEEARDLYKSILDEDPLCYEAVVGLNSIQVLMPVETPVDLKLHYLELALILDPFRYEGFRDIAYYYSQNKDYDKARYYYKQAKTVLEMRATPKEIVNDALKALRTCHELTVPT